ncbi:MAG: lamin tail domain-containing protein, partial [Bacteroidia bacterium]
VSNAQAKDFIFLYDNDLGTGRPIAGTYFESDGTSGGTAYAGFYETAVEGQAKAWGTIIPNTLPNGIRYVASYSQATGNQLCTFSDDDGVWPTGNINTVNPTGFTTNTAIVLSNTDVPMQCFLLPYVNLSASLTSGTEVGSTVITLTATITGTIASAQSIDINVAGLDITGADYTLSSATINFAAGVNPTGTATFTIQNDLLFEGLETATISLLNPSTGIELGFNTVVEIDIVDDEIPKIVINEIMYNNVGGDEEWIELYNNDIVPITIDSTWNITGTPSSGPAWTRFFAGSTSILFSPGQYITVRLGSASAGASFPFAPTLSLSTTADQLTNTGAPIILKKGSAIIDNVTYSPVTFTPAANGGGPALSLNNPSFDNSLAASWGACKINGTPGLANFNCDASTFYSILSGDLNPEVWNATTAIWSTSPTGTEGLIPTFTSTRNLVIQTGTTVRLNYVSTVPSANNITINNGGKLWTDNAVSGSEKYIRLHGNIINNGIVGNGVTYDALGLSIEGINSTLSGTGSYNIGRIRKDLVTNPISMITINANVNLRHAGAAFYNNIGGATLNLTINPGRFLNFTDATGDLAIDGVDGTGLGDRRGNIVVNGILNVSDKIFALTNNTSAASCSMTINATGRVITGNMDANISGSGGALGAFDVTINAGGRLEINKILKVISGDLNSNGGIILRSTNTQTALIDGSGSGNVTGNVTVERKIGPIFGYHYLSSPVQGVFVNNSVSGWRDDFTIIASLDNLQFIPGNVYTALPTVFEYDETNLNPNPSFGWIGATGTTDAITPLKGFACIVSANVTVDVVGVVNNGPINYSVTKASDGINIIGNPYPSPISWTAFRSHNTNLETTYKAFVTTGGYNGSYGDYNIATGLGTNGVGNIIASSQGFLVTAITAGPIQAINTDRTLDLNPTYFTQPVVNADILRLDVVKDDAHDETVIFFAPALATDSYEAIADVKKLMPFNTNHSFIYSVNGNNQLSMNGL